MVPQVRWVGAEGGRFRSTVTLWKKSALSASINLTTPDVFLSRWLQEVSMLCESVLVQALAVLLTI